MKRLIRRSLLPVYYLFNTRARGIRREIRYWDDCLRNGGGAYADEIARRLNPDSIIDRHHREIVEMLAQHEIHILDVGSGPLTSIAKNHPAKSIGITAVDPLADAYRQILHDTGTIAPVPPETCAGEALEEKFGASRFDVVHAQNSLDHSCDPASCIRQMIRVAKPGGYVVLLHAENEAWREGWRGLHRWNFRMKSTDTLEIRGTFGKRDEISEKTIGCEVHNERRGKLILTRIRIPSDKE